MKFRSIRTKIILISGLLFFIFMGILGISSYYYANRYLAISEDESMQLLTENYRGKVETQIDKIFAHLESIADTARVKDAKEVKDAQDIERIVYALQDGLGRMKSLDTIIYIQPNGKAIRPDGKWAEYSDREYFKKVLQTKQNYVSDILISKSTNKLSVILAVPVLKEGALRGIVIGTYALEKMNDLIGDVKVKDTGYGYLVDEKGTVLIHGKYPEASGKLSLTDAKKNAEQGVSVEMDERLKQLYETSRQSDRWVSGSCLFDSDEEQIASFVPIHLPGGKVWSFGTLTPQDEVLALIQNMSNILIGITLVSLLLAMLIAAYLGGKFTQPIILVSRQLEKLAKGDLAVERLAVGSNDEIGALAASCNQMVGNLRELLTKIQKSTEQVAASSEELTSSADQSAQVTTKVAQSITDVADASDRQVEAVRASTDVIGRMSESVGQVAENIKASAEQAKTAAGTAQQGSGFINKAVDQMGSIEKTVNRSAEVVTALGERSKEIGQIVATISGIASQTNLLALNAAIEAARAGEMGKGFAVVAEEVRKLAEQSQEAAKQIAELIGEIQEDTDKAVVAMNEGTGEVKVGAQVVNDAGQAFVSIVDSIEKVSQQIASVSNAVDEITRGTTSVVESMEDIDRKSKNIAEETQSVSAATEEQSASMQEIAAASQGLAKIAQELHEVAGKFRL